MVWVVVPIGALGAGGTSAHARCPGVLVRWYPDKEEAGSPKEGLGGRQVQEAAYTAGYKTSAR